MMRLELERGSGTPLFEQIASALRERMIDVASSVSSHWFRKKSACAPLALRMASEVAGATSAR